MAGAANLTVHSTTLPVGSCISLRLVLGILLFCFALSYPSRDAHHCFCFGGICEHTSLFILSDEDVEGLLQPDRVTRGDQPIVDVKCHQYLYYTFPEPIVGGFFTKRLVEPLPDYGVNPHTKHERGEQTPLSNIPSWH
jgi:hypothetical protein